MGVLSPCLSMPPLISAADATSNPTSTRSVCSFPTATNDVPCPQPFAPLTLHPHTQTHTLKRSGILLASCASAENTCPLASALPASAANAPPPLPPPPVLLPGAATEPSAATAAGGGPELLPAGSSSASSLKPSADSSLRGAKHKHCARRFGFLSATALCSAWPRHLPPAGSVLYCAYRQRPRNPA